MNKKQVIRTVVFLVLVFFVLVLLSDLFEYKVSNISRRYEKFKQLEDDTVDAVYVGSSGVDRYWIPAKAYDEYGMTVYPLSSEGLPSWLVKNMIVEARDKQNPKLIIIDSRPFTGSELTQVTSLAETRARRVIDMIDFFSPNRLDSINRSLKVFNKLDSSISRFSPSYYFTFIRYHNMWNDEAFTFDQLTDPVAKYLGFYLWEGSSVKEYSKPKEAVYTDERIPLCDQSMEDLTELIAYIKENNIDALFVDTPYPIDEKGSGRRNSLADILAENGMNYISYNTPEMAEKYPFDPSADFYNSNHVNYYGAEKFTTIFSEYINENYELSDHRNDERCADDWNGVYDLIKKRIAQFEKNKAKK